jgi:hypothetical protein
MAKSAHGRLANACSGFIAAGSKEAHAQRRAFEVVGTPPPSVDVPAYVEFDVEEPTVVERPKTIAQIASEWTDQQAAVMSPCGRYDLETS